MKFKKARIKRILALTSSAFLLATAVFGGTQIMAADEINVSGDGLKGEYFNNQALSGQPSVTNIDSQINFNWGQSGPNGCGADGFSIRWTGMVKPKYSEKYTFYSSSDDGVKVWVDGQPIVLSWGVHPASESQGYITLEANKKYHIMVEYFEGSGEASVNLSWSSKSQNKEIIPTACLYSESDGTPIPEVRPMEPKDKPEYFYKGKFTPPDGKCLSIVGQDVGSVEGYTNGVIAEPGGVTTYCDISQGNQAWILYGLDTSVDYGAGEINSQKCLDTWTNSALVMGLYLVDNNGHNLTDIASGKMDEYVERLGNFFKADGRPIYLRIGYEFDGSWNHYDPTNYKAAFKYIVDKFADMGVDNVAYVWQACTFMSANDKIMDWYPGDEYVDWVGCSCFVWMDPPYKQILDVARSLDKPLMICEASPQTYDLDDHTRFQGGSVTDEDIWYGWFQQYFDFIYNNSDVIRAAAYINCPWNQQAMWGGLWGDSRIESNEYIKEKWLTEMNRDLYGDGSAFFLQGGPDLFETLAGPQNPAPYVLSSNKEQTVYSDKDSATVKFSNKGTVAATGKLVAAEEYDWISADKSTMTIEGKAKETVTFSIDWDKFDKDEKKTAEFDYAFEGTGDYPGACGTGTIVINVVNKEAVQPGGSTPQASCEPDPFGHTQNPDGSITVWLTPENHTPGFAYCDYTINGENPISFPLVKSSNGNYEYVITGLKEGDVVAYSLKYEKCGPQLFTDVVTVTYGDDTQPVEPDPESSEPESSEPESSEPESSEPESSEPESSEPESSEPEVTDPTSVSFGDTGLDMNGNDATVWFKADGFTPAFIYCEFSVNGSDKLSYPMQLNAATGLYEYTINNVKTGDTVVYSLKYEKKGPQVFTKDYTVTIGETESPVTTEPEVTEPDPEQPSTEGHGVTSENGGATIWFVADGFTPGFIYVNFNLNNTYVQSYGMSYNSSKGRYEYHISNANKGDSLAYSFKYTKNGPQEFTSVYNCKVQ